MKLLPVLIALLMIGLSLPMAMRKVPPNQLYGFRTEKTLSDTKLWYDANQKAGMNLIAAAILALIVWAAVELSAGLPKANAVGLPVLLVFLFAGVVVSMIQVQKM